MIVFETEIDVVMLSDPLSHWQSNGTRGNLTASSVEILDPWSIKVILESSLGAAEVQTLTYDGLDPELTYDGTCPLAAITAAPITIT